MKFHLLTLAALSLTAASPLPGETGNIIPQGLENSGSNIDNTLNVEELDFGLQSFRQTEQLERRVDIPAYVEKLKVDPSTKEAYKNFIERIRRRVQDPDISSHGRPVLPPQQMPPTSWFDIILETESQAVRLRIRSDNLYLDGYRAENSAQWFEFDNGGNNLHLIPESRHLGFDGGYNSLQTAAGRDRSETALGQQQLTTAVNQLATTTDRRERARSLLVIIQMICESIRFTYISDTIASGYSAGVTPNEQFMALENGWGDVSEALLRHDQNPEGPIRLPRPNAMTINSVTDAVALIGVLLRYSINTASRPRRQAQALIPSGRPLAEILWVEISNIDSENPGDLYGTITATDGLSSQYVYNVDRANHQSVYPGDQIALIGPSRSISAASSFVVDFHLMDKDSDASNDDEISQDQISWNVYDPSNKYDVPIQKPINGAYGKAMVDYVVMSSAAEALVEVVMIDGDQEDPADVFGTVRVHSKFVQRHLFSKADNEYIDVRPGGKIPLSRAVMAVSMDDTLEVNVDLTDHDSDASPNDKIAAGLARLKPQVLRSAKETILGKYGKVEVRVTWS
ncbi:Ribosome-inactivating protein [Beauveria brongniartii RCEF 3172]|uniref:rRNA N-glycosylase n=1 Tax=Beauveria brongniartii RCEF 3172 TaxID=1081107 RepID=A0A162JY85_9HYPO|nr:Ribosome-inactivating protein [Beauveria brongniartii RCEF 3172]